MYLCGAQIIPCIGKNKKQLEKVSVIFDELWLEVQAGVFAEETAFCSRSARRSEDKIRLRERVHAGRTLTRTPRCFNDHR